MRRIDSFADFYGAAQRSLSAASGRALHAVRGLFESLRRPPTTLMVVGGLIVLSCRRSLTPEGLSPCPHLWFA